MCLLEHDLTEQHKDEAFSALLLLVESLIIFFIIKWNLTNIKIKKSKYLKMSFFPFSSIYPVQKKTCYLLKVKA